MIRLDKNADFDARLIEFVAWADRQTMEERDATEAGRILDDKMQELFHLKEEYDVMLRPEFAWVDRWVNEVEPVPRGIQPSE